MQVQQLTREFKIGCAIIPDPCPGLPLDSVQAVLASTYPQIRWTRLFETDGVLVGQTLRFEFLIPPVKTNG